VKFRVAIQAPLLVRNKKPSSVQITGGL